MYSQNGHVKVPDDEFNRLVVVVVVVVVVLVVMMTTCSHLLLLRRRFACTRVRVDDDVSVESVELGEKH